MSDGERIAALLASFEAEKAYQHERWHKQDQDLQILIALPERMTREVGKLQGMINGQISSVSKELERSMMAAIEKSLLPVIADVAVLQNDVEALKKKGNVLTGVRLLAVFIVQTLIAALTALAGVFALGRHG